MSGSASAGGRGGASGGKSEPLYDADAPYIVESYQGDFDADDELNAKGQPPAYSYSHSPGPSSNSAPTRSWDDASRAKPNPINPTGDQQASQSHAYVDMEAGGIPGGFPGSMPAPLNSSITGYATAHGWDLGKLCLACYVLPPFTSAIVLIWETQNDLARFHAYQSGVCGVLAICGLWILRRIFGLKSLVTLLRVALLGVSWYAGYIANKAASSLEREPFVPHVGAYAISWVGEE